MTTGHTVQKATTRGNAAVLITLRIIGAALLVGMGVIHYDLWSQSGTSSQFGLNLVVALFLVNAIVSVLFAIVVLVIPTKMLGITATLASLFTLGTLVALFVSIFWTLFGYPESFSTPLVVPAIIEEAVAVVLLAVLATVAARANGMWKWLPGSSD